MMKKRTPTYADGTIADWIEKYIRERSQPGGRQIGPSQRYILRAIQRAAIGAVHHTALKAVDFLNHCKARCASGTKPQTVQQDITYLSGMLKYAVEIWEIPTAERAYAAYKKAKPQLMKEQLIAKSQARDRLPTDEEKALLRAHFVEQIEHPKKRMKNVINMAIVMDAELATGRRISELCRIERQHVNVEARTCWVYNLKNSKGKGFHAEFALIEGAWELFEQRLKEIPNEPTARLFPYVAKSCGAKYTRAKAALQKLHPGLFENLRMHDNRAEAFVTLLEKGYSETQVQKGVSLHKGDGKVLRQVYLRVKARDLHAGPANQVAAH
jgi:integrase